MRALCAEAGLLCDSSSLVLAHAVNNAQISAARAARNIEIIAPIPPLESGLPHLKPYHTECSPQRRRWQVDRLASPEEKAVAKNCRERSPKQNRLPFFAD